MYLDGLNAWEDVPFQIREGAEQGGAAAGAPGGMVTRQVDAVVDLDAMRAELEASQAGGQRG